MPQRNIRFYVFENGCPIKLTMEPGMVLRHYHYELTDEGWSSTARTWAYDGETLRYHWFTDGRDCDGRMQRSGTEVCDSLLVRSGPDDPDFAGVYYPAWRPEGGVRQRDFSAEAMGY